MIKNDRAKLITDWNSSTSAKDGLDKRAVWHNRSWCTKERRYDHTDHVRNTEKGQSTEQPPEKNERKPLLASSARFLAFFCSFNRALFLCPRDSNKGRREAYVTIYQVVGILTSLGESIFWSLPLSERECQQPKWKHNKATMKRHFYLLGRPTRKPFMNIRMNLNVFRLHLLSSFFPFFCAIIIRK